MTIFISVYISTGRLNEVNVKFFSCEEEPVTLLRHCLWSTSPECPRLAFETSLMDWLRAFVLDCQVFWLLIPNPIHVPGVIRY